MLAAGGIYLALGDRAEGLFLFSFVFVVIGITLVQERMTQRALESLRDLSAPRALAIRDGEEQRIAGREVVRDALLVLHENDRIAADAQLLEGLLKVDGSLLTGEAVPVAKLPVAQEQPASASVKVSTSSIGSLFASTVATRGVGAAQVQATADHTAAKRIGANLAATTEPVSALQGGLRKLVRRLGAGALVLASA